MAKIILKELGELVDAGVISEDISEKIKTFYRSQPENNQNKLIVLFGILGAVLTGLGIILIVAHNWDEMPKGFKVFFSFLPLIAGQAICGYVLLKKQDNVALKESATSFVFFAVGACIALISQVYNIPGNLSSFLFTWMLLCLPLFLVMKSAMGSLLYIAGITYYATEAGYFSYPKAEPMIYWLLLLPALLFYRMLLRKNPSSGFVVFHNWFIPLSVIIALGTLADANGDFMVLAYVCLFSLLYLIGESAHLSDRRIFSNGYLVLGSVGTIVMLLVLSFDWFWDELRDENPGWYRMLASPEIYVVAMLILIASVFLYRNNRKVPLSDFNPIGGIFILFTIIFVLGFGSGNTAMALTNILVFITGLFTIRKGSRNDHLGVLNYGLLIITVLVVCRFFDTNLSFIVRGLLFVGVGIGFFVANTRMIKKRRSFEK